MATGFRLGLFALSNESLQGGYYYTHFPDDTEAQNSHTQLVSGRAGLESGTGRRQNACLPSQAPTLPLHVDAEPGHGRLSST